MNKDQGSTISLSLTRSPDLRAVWGRAAGRAGASARAPDAPWERQWSVVEGEIIEWVTWITVTRPEITDLHINEWLYIIRTASPITSNNHKLVCIFNPLSITKFAGAGKIQTFRENGKISVRFHLREVLDRSVHLPGLPYRDQQVCLRANNCIFLMIRSNSIRQSQTTEHFHSTR